MAQFLAATVMDQLGVDAASLFPDLDGLSSHLMWLRSDGH